jgi:hypothetical protein
MRWAQCRAHALGPVCEAAQSGKVTTREQARARTHTHTRTHNAPNDTQRWP